MTRRRLILLELNEINFDIVQQYLDADKSRLPALRQLMALPGARTTAEKRYEELEPWIQWPSVHTGLRLDEHGVFRLGDMVQSSASQFFELLEERGVRVGVISAMNAVNRLRNPAYFIPDPWTKTDPDQSWWSRSLAIAISQAVNDNSEGRIAPANLLRLIVGIIRFARLNNYGEYFRLAAASRGAPWRKALFLDLFLHDLHLGLFRSARAEFSTLFLNAGAHIQHHYFFNSAPVREAVSLRNPEWYVDRGVDPLLEMLEVYDRIVGDYLREPGIELIVATGLSQRPYDRVKFYYRLRDHATFLRLLGVRFARVFPRMTRDFLVEFNSPQEAADAESILSRVKVAGSDERFFDELDNRGSSLFVTLTYPHEIREDTEIEVGCERIRVFPHVVFVAIKNGMHQGTGFAYFTNGVSRFAPTKGAHVKEIFQSVMGFFDQYDEQGQRQVA